jgi:hypothetical protein
VPGEPRQRARPALAQAPQGINYQGVARDSEGKAVASKTLSVRISILKNSATGEFNMIYRREDGNIGWVEPHTN